MTATLKVSFIITTFNRRKVLASTLPTVPAFDFPMEALEIIVVVDGLTIGTAEFLHSLKCHPVLRIVEQLNGVLARTFATFRPKCFLAASISSVPSISKEHGW